ncbi:MAG TPA: hypothetical protein VFA75_08880 [Nevskia sp.]|nr:hypothetical protein [Nevskia sp.]
MRFPLLALMLVISGCMTHDRVKAPPVAQAPMQVFVAKAPPSGLDGLPIGAYQIDDASFVVSGHQSGASLGAVLLFGAPGLAAANAAEGARSRRELGDSPARLTSDLTVPAFALLADDIGRRGLGERFRLTVSPSWGDDAQVLTVIPYVLLAYEENDQVRPYIFLKASLAAGDERRWSTRYISA